MYPFKPPKEDGTSVSDLNISGASTSISLGTMHDENDASRSLLETRHDENDDSHAIAIEDSRLGGVTFGNALGRFVCLYWQDESGSIMESTYLQIRQDKWCLTRVNRVTKSGDQQPSLDQPASQTPKLHTPLCAVCWANGMKRWVFFLDQWNSIHEMVTDDGGQSWQIGPLKELEVFARNNSCLAATIDGRLWLLPNILVYYQNQKCQIKRLTFKVKERQWVPCDEGGDHDPVTALAGTSIAAMTDETREWAYSLTAADDDDGADDDRRRIQEFDFKTRVKKKPIPGFYDGRSTFYACGKTDGRTNTPAGQVYRVYVHTGEAVQESAWFPQTGWKTVQRLEGIGKRFIALEWYKDDQDEPETHLFSISPSNLGHMVEYVVGQNSVNPDMPLS